jgi:ABC-type multidrug transport system permease subunit
MSLLHESPAPLERLDWRANLRVCWVFVRRSLRLWTYFKLNFLVGQAEVVSNLIIFAMIASLRGDRSGAMPGAGAAGGYVSFVILGLILNTVLTTALAAPYQGLLDSYWSNRLELLMMSPIRLPLFVVGTSIGSYVQAGIQVGLYAGLGWLWFGFAPWGAGWAVAGLLVLLGAFACTGLGLVAASSIYHLDARGGRDPVRFVVGLLTGLAAGVYFPVSTLPVWVQWLACCIPQTYALDGVRRALLGPASAAGLLPLHRLVPLSPTAVDALALLCYGLVVGPIGWHLFEGAIGRAKVDGRLSRWV